MVEGDELQLTNTVDGPDVRLRRDARDEALHRGATVPKGYPPATLFQTSIVVGRQGRQGHPLRDDYNNEFHGLRQYPVPGHTAGVGGGQ